MKKLFTITSGNADMRVEVMVTITSSKNIDKDELSEASGAAASNIMRALETVPFARTDIAYMRLRGL